MMDSESESRRLENDDLRENDGLGWMPGEGPKHRGGGLFGCENIGWIVVGHDLKITRLMEKLGSYCE